MLCCLLCLWLSFRTKPDAVIELDAAVKQAAAVQEKTAGSSAPAPNPGRASARLRRSARTILRRLVDLEIMEALQMMKPVEWKG